MQGDPSQARRVDAVLHQLGSLPTLSPIAVRLLELTTDDEVEAAKVIQLIESDPALATKVLKMCRCHSRGRASQVKTVERAVLLIGFQAVRSAVLSIQIFDALEKTTSDDGSPLTGASFDRASFWHHSLAVAVLSQSLATSPRFSETVQPGHAFIAGLLHDLGLLTLHVVLPDSLDRVCQLAESQNVLLDIACRKFVGLDTHTVGKRLAEHWGLPAPLTDVMWLHGQPIDLLPDLPHRDLIALVTLADAIARSCYVTPVGHGPRGERLDVLAEQLGLSREDLDREISSLHERVGERASVLGLDTEHSSDLLLAAISRANATLGRINETTQHRAMLAEQQRHVLDAISTFHDQQGYSSIVDVWVRLIQSAAQLFGGHTYAGIYQLMPSDVWQLVDVSEDGRVLGHRLLEDDARGALFQRLAISDQRFVPLAGLLTAVAFDPPLDHFTSEAHAIGLDCGWGVTAVIIIDDPELDRVPSASLEPVLRTWSATLAAAAQHEAARRLTEQLAESNQELVETQHALARKETMAAVGEIAAGAAHEMNNPLTVISGRSQLLARRLEEGPNHDAAAQIAEQAHRLSNMITALRRFASPPEPSFSPLDLEPLLDETLASSTTDVPSINVTLEVAPDVPTILADGAQLRRAVEELLQNAVESEGTREIHVSVQIDAANDRLRIQITDDGSGLSDQIMVHAFDPFFSAKPAGRQPGLGLAEAQRAVEAHGGHVTLHNGQPAGAVATIWIPLRVSTRNVA